jgi:O-antigen ligase
MDHLNFLASQLTRAAIFGLFFSLSLSRSLFIFCAVLALTGWVLSRKQGFQVDTLRKNTASLLMFGFIVYLFIISAILYAGAETNYALDIYWKLLLIPVISSSLLEEGDVDRCWRAYAVGIVILTAHIFLLPWFEIPWVSSPDAGSVFFNPLPQAMCLAIFAGWCAFRLFKSDQGNLRRLFFVIGILLSTWAVFVVSHQRLAALTWAIMVGGACVVHTPKRWRWKGVIFVIFVVVVFLFSNDAFREKMLLGVHELQAYDHESDYSSIGSRLHMWAAAWSGIQEAPLFGRGAGSYSRLAEEFFADPVMCAIGCLHPHQQYLLIWVESGAVGLSLYLGILALIARYHLKHSGFNPLALPLLLVVFFAGFVDSLFWYRGYLYLFVPLLGLVMIQQSNQNGVLSLPKSNNLSEKT